MTQALNCQLDLVGSIVGTQIRTMATSPQESISKE